MESLRTTSEGRQRGLAEAMTLRQTQSISRSVASHADASEGGKRLHVGDGEMRSHRFAREERLLRRLHSSVGCVQRALHRVVRRWLQRLQQETSMACVVDWTTLERRSDRGGVVGAHQRSRTCEIHVDHRHLSKHTYRRHFHRRFCVSRPPLAYLTVDTPPASTTRSVPRKSSRSPPLEAPDCSAHGGIGRAACRTPSRT